MKRILCGVLGTLAICCRVGAQTDQAEPLHIGSVNVSGIIHERYEAWDFFAPKSGENSYGYSGSMLRLTFSQQTTSYDWAVEMVAPILLGIPQHAVLAAPQGQLGLGGSYYAANHAQNAALVFPKQAFFRVKGEHSSLRLGRFEFADGGEVTPKDQTLAIVKRDGIAQRLIGIFGFADVQRSFDGAHLAYANGPWNVTVMSAIPTRGVFQVDGWGWVKTPVTYAAVTRQMALGHSNAEWRVFGIYYNDTRGVLKTDNRTAAARALDTGAINIGTYGGHYIQAVPTAAGTFDLLGWGVLQNGTWGALKQRSGAGAVEGGYQPPILKPVRPWLRGGYFYSSGDGNPNDGTHGTFFAILPTPRAYARFPFFNEMNNRDLFGELMLRPRKNLAVRSDIHGLWLANRNDLWYSGGGAFQPWTFGYNGRPSNGATGLATLYDVSVDYQWPHGVSTGVYYGYARGGAVVQHIFTNDSNSQFGFLEFNYRF